MTRTMGRDVVEKHEARGTYQDGSIFAMGQPWKAHGT